MFISPFQSTCFNLSCFFHQAATVEVDEVVDEAAVKMEVGEEEEVISKLSTYAGRLLLRPNRPHLFVFSCSVFRPLRVVDL